VGKLYIAYVSSALSVCECVWVCVCVSVCACAESRCPVCGHLSSGPGRLTGCRMPLGQGYRCSRRDDRHTDSRAPRRFRRPIILPPPASSSLPLPPPLLAISIATMCVCVCTTWPKSTYLIRPRRIGARWRKIYERKKIDYVLYVRYNTYDQPAVTRSHKTFCQSCNHFLVHLLVMHSYVRARLLTLADTHTRVRCDAFRA